MSGTFPQKARPVPFTAEQPQSLEVPVLLVLGERDNLVGDPEKAKTLVQDIPKVRVEILDTEHLIGAEQSERVNALILEFFEPDLSQETEAVVKQRRADLWKQLFPNHIEIY